MILQKRKGLTLYQKFAMLIILAGILPIALISSVLVNQMFNGHARSLKENYVQGLRYSSYSLETLLDSYNDISKFSYYYSYSSEGSFTYAYVNYDNLRQILTGENYQDDEREQRIQNDMYSFLRNVLKMSSGIEEVHFVYAPQPGEIVSYHSGNYDNKFNNFDLFADTIGLSDWDTESRELIIIPTHSFAYVGNASKRVENVLTIARNYYDLKGMVGKEKYVGTLYVDFAISQMQEIFSGIDIYNRGNIYVSNMQGDCLYSTDSQLVGKNLNEENIDYSEAPAGGLLLSEHVAKYGISIYFRLDSSVVGEDMLNTQKVMYVVVLLAALILSFASISFSRRLIRPMRVMMKRMGDIEEGRFESKLAVTSNDEIGELAARFNQMSTELRNYTNQAYVSKIKQTEAELNALKSQIYPHFLYNTLEVIRMTAVSNNDEKVAGMIEALSEQIRYLIGTVGDVVPLKTEISNLEKYIYLVNCRYNGQISFSVDANNLEGRYVPKLVLQPIVENAQVHGLKGMDWKGRIQLDITQKDNDLEITILDNGHGMPKEEIERINKILQSSKPGQRTESGWKSIGLKNVHDRLRYLYGEHYGLALYSTPGVGTAITVRLPADIAPEED